MAEIKFDLQASIKVRDLLRTMMEHGGWQILETWLRDQIMLLVDTGLSSKATPTEMAHVAGEITAYRKLPKWVKQQHDALDAQIRQHLAKNGGSENVPQ
jgi:hypothetical protein